MEKEIYHYDQHDYFYLGAEIVQCIEGSDSLPFSATDSQPPPREFWGDKNIPIFDPEKKEWRLEKNEFWHFNITEFCFYSGRDSSGPLYVAASRSSPSYHIELTHYVNKLPMCSIPRLGNVPNFVHLAQRIDFINDCIYQLEMNWLRTTNFWGWPLMGQGANFYHYQAETLVAAIRRLLDDLVMAVFCRKFYEYEPWRRNLPIDGYSMLLNKPMKHFKTFFDQNEKGEKSDELCHQFINIILGENKEFLITIQGLSNTYKHSLAANLVRGSYGVDFPSVLSVGVADHSQRNLGHLSYHNHSLRQLILGLNDYLDDLIGRLSQDSAQTEKQKCISHRLESFRN